MNWADELRDQIKNAVEQQTNGYRSVVFGHIANYDPALGRARFIYPSFTDGDTGDAGYVLSGWTPVGTAFAGPGYGLQCAPVGGATPQNPTEGELCVLSFSEREYGVITAAHMLFNQVNTPPNPDLEPGEMHLQGKGGAMMTTKSDGSLVTTVPNTHQIASSDWQAAHIVQTGGYVISQIPTIDKLKFNIGGTWYQLESGALTASAPPPTPG